MNTIIQKNGVEGMGDTTDAGGNTTVNGDYYKKAMSRNDWKRQERWTNHRKSQSEKIFLRYDGRIPITKHFTKERYNNPCERNKEIFPLILGIHLDKITESGGCLVKAKNFDKTFVDKEIKEEVLR